jgi:hypothetical protein
MRESAIRLTSIKESENARLASLKSQASQGDFFVKPARNESSEAAMSALRDSEEQAAK